MQEPAHLAEDPTDANGTGLGPDQGDAPVLGSVEDFAEILTQDYWASRGSLGGAWNLSTSPIITYNATNVPAALQSAVENAFATWSYYTGISYVPVRGLADINFFNSTEFSAARFSTFGREINSAEIYLEDDLVGLVDRFRNYVEFVVMHEIGHAMGLGHAGIYNGSATFGVDTSYDNDTMLMSMMSYFTPGGRLNYNVPFDAFPSTLMPADLEAIDQLYGLPQIEAGNTIYGYNSNAGGPIGRMIPENGGLYTIYDSGGIDTINYAQHFGSANIDLRVGGISTADDVATGLVIANGTVIENAIGSDFSERITGNQLANTLQGRDGADTIIGGAGDDRIEGGATAADLSDRVFGGDGNDWIHGGAGNDVLRGEAGNDEILGAVGADTLIGGNGGDVLTGGQLSDLLTGGAGSDFLNGGFGFDRLEGGDGADRFYHQGIASHGTDWIRDFREEDVLIFGGSATREDFQVNVARTDGAGADAIAEAFVIYRPTDQILWALVDGADQDALSLRTADAAFDLFL